MTAYPIKEVEASILNRLSIAAADVRDQMQKVRRAQELTESELAGARMLSEPDFSDLVKARARYNDLYDLAETTLILAYGGEEGREYVRLAVAEDPIRWRGRRHFRAQED